MAFEPQRSIAGIMTAYGGKFPSAIGGLAQGYERGVQTRMLKDEAELRKRQLDQQRVEKMKDDVGRKALAVYMLPEQDRILGWAEFRNSVITDYGTDPGEYSLENLNETLLESDIGAKVQLSEIEHQRSQGQFGKPFEAINAQGRRVFVERAPDGTMREVEGYTAPSPASLMDRPSSLQEWDAFNRMSPEDQARYLTMKRATPTLNLGGTQVQLDPARGGVMHEYPVTLKPGETPAIKREQSEQAAIGSAVGKAQGEAVSSLTELEATYPRLVELVDELSALGNIATYTQAGQLSDTVKREMGLHPGAGAVARKEYVSKVDNEILPLLRQTFGAQFTEREGQSLKATLGDPNASPAEKDAVLRSFIKTKFEQIKTLQRRTSVPQQPAQQSPEYTNYGPRAQPQSGGIKFLGFE